jgi:hypothetical protein
MIALSERSPFKSIIAVSLFVLSSAICLQAKAQTLNCVEVASSGSTNCSDSGGVGSTCASAKCPAQFTLTGAGGACAAGDRKIKSLFPRVDDGTVTIMCEQQGVAPQAVGVCCQLKP